MAHEAFDPRKTVRTKIGTDWLFDGIVRKCINVTGSGGDTIHVPMYTREEKEILCPTMPFIVIDLLGIPAIPHNIRATVRQHSALLSFDITYTDDDGMDVDTFGKKVADEIVDLTRTNQCSTTGINFYNVNNQGRLHVEGRCEEVIFHWIMELEATFNDAC